VETVSRAFPEALEVKTKGDWALVAVEKH